MSGVPQTIEENLQILPPVRSEAEMGLIRFLAEGILSILLLTIFEIVTIGSLWVLRVAINWWLDVDYVEVLKRWTKK